MKIKIILFVLGLCAFTSIAQNINEYKYIEVPEQYAFLNGPDEYQLNSLTKFLFNKYGFDAYLRNEKRPEDLKNQRCVALYADVLSESTFLRSKLTVILRDCDNNIIFRSEEGVSKAKEYKKSYHEALREAFISIEELNYRYDESPEAEPLPLLQDAQSSPMDLPTNTMEMEDDETAIGILVVEPKVLSLEIEEVGSIDQTAPSSVYKTKDGSYTVAQYGNILKFSEGSQSIGAATAIANSKFPILTSAFEGIGYFEDGHLKIDRAIKGIAETVVMTFYNTAD